MAILEVKGLEVYYGVIQAIKGISFEVNQGEIIALIGANGAGKTTTLHAITGLVRIKSGSVIYDGHDLRKTDPSRIVTMGLAHVPALMSHPKLIVMDEPSMGLSPLYVNEIFDIIQKINKDGVTVLLVEQNAKKALSIANRAYVLETGKIALSGDAKELMNDDSVKKAYLSE